MLFGGGGGRHLEPGCRGWVVRRERGESAEQVEDGGRDCQRGGRPVSYLGRAGNDD